MVDVQRRENVSARDVHIRTSRTRAPAAVALDPQARHHSPSTDRLLKGCVGREFVVDSAELVGGVVPERTARTKAREAVALVHTSIIPGPADGQDLALAHGVLPIHLPGRKEEAFALVDGENAAVAKLGVVRFVIAWSAGNKEAPIQGLAFLRAFVIEVQLR